MARRSILSYCIVNSLYVLLIITSVQLLLTHYPIMVQTLVKGSFTTNKSQAHGINVIQHELVGQWLNFVASFIALVHVSQST